MPAVWGSRNDDPDADTVAPAPKSKSSTIPELSDTATGSLSAIFTSLSLSVAIRTSLSLAGLLDAIRMSLSLSNMRGAIRTSLSLSVRLDLVATPERPTSLRLPFFADSSQSSTLSDRIASSASRTSLSLDWSEGATSGSSSPV